MKKVDVELEYLLDSKQDLTEFLSALRKNLGIKFYQITVKNELDCDQLKKDAEYLNSFGMLAIPFTVDSDDVIIIGTRTFDVDLNIIRNFVKEYGGYCPPKIIR